MAQKRSATQVSPLNSTENGNGHIDNASLAELVTPAVIEAEQIDLTTRAKSEKSSGSRFSEFVLADDEEGGEDSEPVLTKCPAKKPGEFDIFRVHTEPEWSIETLIVEYRGENKALPRGFYLIHPRLKSAFGKKGRKHLIVTCVNTNGSMFLWPIKVTEGFGDSWYRSALIVVKAAKEKWVKDFASDGNGYTAEASKREHGEPRWLGGTLDDLLELAFDGRIVSDRTHPLCFELEIE
jgi:hypothetical protein